MLPISASHDRTNRNLLNTVFGGQFNPIAMRIALPNPDDISLSKSCSVYSRAAEVVVAFLCVHISRILGHCASLNVPRVIARTVVARMHSAWHRPLTARKFVSEPMGENDAAHFWVNQKTISFRSPRKRPLQALIGLMFGNCPLEVFESGFFGDIVVAHRMSSRDCGVWPDSLFTQRPAFSF